MLLLEAALRELDTHATGEQRAHFDVPGWIGGGVKGVERVKSEAAIVCDGMYIEVHLHDEQGVA